MPTRLAELGGFKLPAPTSNWLSHSDFENLFEITGLETVRFEDRMLLPADVPGLAPLLNRYIGKLPGCQRLSMYRIYALRRREVLQKTSKVSVSVIVPTRNEAGNVAAAIARTPLMGSRTELIFVEGGSTDGTWETIDAAIKNYRGPLEIRPTGNRAKARATRSAWASQGDRRHPDDSRCRPDRATRGTAGFLRCRRPRPWRLRARHAPRVPDGSRRHAIFE